MQNDSLADQSDKQLVGSTLNLAKLLSISTIFILHAKLNPTRRILNHLGTFLYGGVGLRSFYHENMSRSKGLRNPFLL